MLANIFLLLIHIHKLSGPPRWSREKARAKTLGHNTTYLGHWAVPAHGLAIGGGHLYKSPLFPLHSFWQEMIFREMKA